MKLRPRLTYTTFVATIALFVALGGAGYAATILPKGSVGPTRSNPRRSAPARSPTTR